MPWDSMLGDLEAFAVQLTILESTERTGQTLLMLLGAFNYGWRTTRTLSCGDSAIPVPPPRDKGIHPTKCDVVDAEVRFIFTLGDDIDAALLPARADFQVRVTGFAAYDLCSVELEDHWRVDTHAFSGDPREPHPYLHFQRGGHAQKAWVGSPNFVPGPSLPDKNGESWQSLLQTPGPRVPFPPLCPILAIDYVIGQHDGDVWKQLRRFPEYREAIRSSQDRLWTPFFQGLAQVELRRRWLGPIVV